jgi:hypothetical protein
MKSLISSMFVYWIILLAVSLGAASLIYTFWLHDVLM